MKTPVALLAFAALPAVASDFNSPNQRSSVQANDAVSVSDQGQTALVLDPQPQGVKSLDVSWSPDSTRVLVVENYPKGSAVIGAWKDAGGWHKSVQESARVMKGIKGTAGVSVTTESRLVEDWPLSDCARVRWDVRFSNGTSIRYVYLLRFTPNLSPPNRGGFTPNALTAARYDLE